MAAMAAARRHALSSNAVRGPNTGTRVAFWAFVALLVIAFFVLVFVIGYYWFEGDDWFFLAGRETSSPHDLFAPYNSHWSTMPILVYRALYAVFGARTYVPYLMCIVSLHLSACALLRTVMRRAAVGPWIATVAAGAFVLFGPGEQNIIWAFQIGFTGSLAFGLAHIVLADHDGAFDRRDWLGLLAGAVALMSSGVGIAMAIAAGIATLVRRGWKSATLHTMPLAALYGAWWLAERPGLLSNAFGRPTPRLVYDWVRSAETGTFLALGRFTAVAIALAAMLVVGLVLAWAPLPRATFRARAAMPLALLVSGLVFGVMTAYGRWFLGLEDARSSRYVHIGAAMLLPALAVAADAFTQRWRVLLAPLAALFLVAVPANATDFQSTVFGPAFMKNQQELVTNIARIPQAHDVPRSSVPIQTPFFYPPLGYLLDASASGKIRVADRPLSSGLRDELLVRLDVMQGGRVAGRRCVRYLRPIVLRPAKGDKLAIKTPVFVSTAKGAGSRRIVRYQPWNGQRLTIQLHGLELRIGPSFGEKSFVLCDAPGH